MSTRGKACSIKQLCNINCQFTPAKLSRYTPLDARSPLSLLCSKVVTPSICNRSLFKRVLSNLGQALLLLSVFSTVSYMFSWLFCVCLCVCMYLCMGGSVSVSIFVEFYLELLYILCCYDIFLQSIPSIYTSMGKTVLFCVSFKQNPFLQTFFCPQIPNLLYFHYFIFFCLCVCVCVCVCVSLVIVYRAWATLYGLVSESIFV